eukprot:6660639-Prymnesium_polylepis.1
MGASTPARDAGTCRRRTVTTSNLWRLARVDVLVLVFETFGGFNESVVRLLKRLAGGVRNKLSMRQYDETT